MELHQAASSVGLCVWYRPANLSALEPVEVRVLSTSQMLVHVSTVLEGPVMASEVIIAAPEDLHFERSGFESWSDTDPAPAPDVDEAAITPRSPL